MQCKNNLSKLFLAVFTAFFVTGVQFQTPSSAAPVTPSALDQASEATVLETYGQLPLSFEANQGQTDGQVKFLSRGSGYNLFLTATEAVLVLSKAAVPMTADVEDAQATVPIVLRMQLINANPPPRVTGLEKLPGKVNYFIGSDPTKWHTDIPTYAKVKYQDVYPGVDLIYYGNRRQLEYDFVVAPGADPKTIKLGFQGADKLEVDDEGDLVVRTTDGHIRLQKPFVYQEMDGVTQEISGGYVLTNRNQVSFQVAAYNPARPLIIDPVLVYSTFLGGSGFDEGKAVAADASGNVYVAGHSESTWGSPISPHAGGISDGFAAKLDSNGVLQWLTFMGSAEVGGPPAGIDESLAIAVDDSGNVYVTGQSFGTWGSPVHPYGGGTMNWSDGFAVKLNPSGVLQWNTFLGSAANDWAQAIAVDDSGNVYVAGTSEGAWGSPINAYTDRDEAYVARLNASDGARQWHTFMGSADGHDISRAIALDSTGNIYVGGLSEASWGTPLPVNPHVAGVDGFVARLNANGVRIWNTFAGGSGDDVIRGIAVDGDDNVLISGSTQSDWGNPDEFAGFIDAFAAKLQGGDVITRGERLWYTIMGSEDDDRSHAVTVDDDGNVFLTGFSTHSWGAPVSPHDAAEAPDAFVTKLNTDGALQWNTFVGDSGDDRGRGIALDGSGYLYLAGYSSAPWGSPSGGGTDAFVAKLDVNTTDLSVSKSDSSDPVVADQILTYTLPIANNGPSDATGVTLSDTLPAGVTLGSFTATQGDCNESGGTVTCDLGSLANGASATVTIVVTPTATGAISNTVSVAGNEADPDLTNNTAIEETTVEAAVSCTVTNLNDSGPGSLREAINCANTNPGPDTIDFNIPGAGPHTIRPTSALPIITDPVTIDGYTQPGASLNTNPPGLGINAALKIELDGTNAGAGVHGLYISAGDSIVRGLAINRFSGAGIRIASSGNVVKGNFIGTDVNGAVALGNGTCNNIFLCAGVLISGDSNRVGTDGNGVSDEAERNLINSNSSGVSISGNNNVVAGNLVGTDSTGTMPLGNTGIGVYVGSGSDNRIGTDGDGIADTAERNVISGNSSYGVAIQNSSTVGTIVAGNYIGTDTTGTVALGNRGGIRVSDGAPNTRIGTDGNGISDAVERNISSGNRENGVEVYSGTDTVVAGNFIGTDVTGTFALGNGWWGIQIVGGRVGTNSDGVNDAAERNIISGNGNDGVLVVGPGTVVAGNYIGTDISGTLALGNAGSGVYVSASSSTIGGAMPGAGNIIAFNDEDGVFVPSNRTAITIRSNSIFSNNELGIDLSPNGVTPNDPLDSDTGANNLQNYPVLTAASSDASSTTIEGTLNSAPNTNFTLEFFANPTCDPSDFGEGENFVGSAMRSTDGSGIVNFTVTLPVAVPGGQFITATATDPEGNTSEFCQCLDFNTPLGTNVVVRPIDATTGTRPVTLTFDEVTQAGTTSLTTSGVGPPPPPGFRLGNPPIYYELTTTAAFSGAVEVCIDYSGIAFGNESKLKLFHREDPNWEDRTVSLDTANDIICASVDFFSPFAIFEPENQPPVAADDAYEMYENTLTIAAPGVLDNDIDAENDPLTAVLVSGPSSGTLALNTDGSFTYTPGAGFGGIDSFTYKANDGTADSNVATVTITHMLIVRNLNDSGDGSLRWTITNANVHPGPDTIKFAVAGTINVLSQLPTLTDTTGGTTIDGTTAPGYAGAPVVVLSGPGTNAVMRGLKITSANNEVRALQIVSFGFGIEIIGSSASGNVIAGNYIGTDGTTDLGNIQHGVQIDDAPSNTIGGTTPDARNLISGNNSNGILIQGSAATGNLVQGNFIGTDVNGTAALGNSDNGVNIIFAADNTIGGTTAGARNVISGNSRRGVYIVTDSTGNLVQGNFIGTDVNGTTALGNANAGVQIRGSSSNRIGGTTSGARNVISGNAFDGVLIESTSGNLVQGNFIGTDVNGTTALGNNFHGVRLENASDNTIGGATAGAGNVISGNTGGFGIVINGSGSTGNLIQGNFIGIDVMGTAALGHPQSGVSIDRGAANNTIGGTTAEARNVISGNSGHGVEINHGGGNLVQGNFIGTDVNGTTALGNLSNGIRISSSTNNTIGGTTVGAGNVLSGNGRFGVQILSIPSTGNVVQGNFIGTDVFGTTALGNSNDGVRIEGGASNNTIGGTTSTARNVISGNGGLGVFLAVATGNVVQGNFIGTDVAGTAALGNTSFGVSFGGNTSNNIIGGADPGAGNIIAFNGDDGVAGSGTSGIDNGILSNAIFSNSGLGIDLTDDGVTPNDTGDGDTGANNLQNFPVLTSATSDATSTTIEGTLNSTPNTDFTLEFFANSACDPSGFGEGETFLGSDTVTTDSGGNVSFAVTIPTPVPLGEFITATATDPDNNTSEFSECGVDVEPPNQPPVATDDSDSTAEDTPVNIDVLANDTDPDGDTLTIDSVTQGSNGSVTNNGNDVTYTPNANYCGDDSFIYTVSDGNGGTDTATVDVTVTCVNDAPVAVDDAYSVDEDNTLTMDVPGVLANDNDVEGDTLTAVLVTGTSNGTLILNADGSFTYTPDANFNGTDTFTYKANDGVVDSNTATVTITVNPVNDPPEANDDAAQTDEDIPVAINVLANDTDVDGDALTVESVAQGTNGTVTINADGTVTYSPNPGYSGTDTFTYTISDGNGGTATATVTVTVIPANTPPTANAGGPYSVDEGGSVPVNASGSDPENDPLTFAWDLDNDGTFETPGQSVTFSAAALDGPSSHTIVVQVTDDGGLSDTDQTTVEVLNVAPTATFANTSGTINEGESATLVFSDPFDPSAADAAAGFLYSYDCTDDGMFEISDGSAASFVCDYPDNGTFTARGRIKDKDGGFTDCTVEVTVNNVAPTVDEVIAPLDPVQVNTGINASADFTDPGVLDTHTAVWDWGDGNQCNTSTDTDCTLTEPSSSDPGSVSGNHTYTTPGVYTVSLTVTDKDGDSGQSIFQFVVVYDPEGGFVTGGGWIWSEAGYCRLTTACEGAEGKANFGFVSKYKKGADVPTGETEFQFKAGNLNFHSDSYDWLVVAGHKAMYKGVGTINGTGNYGFMLSAIDEKLTPSTDVDLFRIKIWDKDNGDAIVYDNQMDAEDDADPATAIGGGNIVIHK